MIEKIDEGAFGIVFKGTDLSEEGSLVAVKVNNQACQDTKMEKFGRITRGAVNLQIDLQTKDKQTSKLI